MRDDNSAGSLPVVPRSLAPHAPEDSMFPSVPRMDHDWYCEKDLRRYECSCGLFELRLKRGDFVRYDASMCQVVHPSKGKKLPPALLDLDRFIRLLVEKTASVDMQRFNREED